MDTAFYARRSPKCTIGCWHADTNYCLETAGFRVQPEALNPDCMLAIARARKERPPGCTHRPVCAAEVQSIVATPCALQDAVNHFAGHHHNLRPVLSEVPDGRPVEVLQIFRVGFRVQGLRGNPKCNFDLDVHKIKLRYILRPRPLQGAADSYDSYESVSATDAQILRDVPMTRPDFERGFRV